MILTIVTGGLWAIIWAVIASLEKGRPIVHKYTCQLCGYQWNWQEGTPYPPVMVRPDLIANGVRKLEEEERRRQDDWDWYRQE